MSRKVAIIMVLVVLLVIGSPILSQQPASDKDRQSNGESLYPPLSYDGRYVAFYSFANNLVPNDTNETGDVFVHDTQTETTTRVSVNSEGQEGNYESTFPSISGNGRYVVFTSSASNLVEDDTNRKPDIFVHDRKTGKTTRVSISSNGEEGNGVSYTYFPSISADGRFIAFASKATNLADVDENGTYDIFVHDRNTGMTRLVSVNSDGKQGDGPSLHAVISGNGRYVAFHSFARNLVPYDFNNVEDVFLHDLKTDKTIRINVDARGREANGSSDRAAISYDGHTIAFSSAASNLVDADTNSAEDVFIYHLDTEGVERVSISSAGEQMNASDDDDVDTGDLICCAVSTICCVIIITDRKSVISPDGTSVIYRSDANNLVSDDRNFWQDIFIYDMDTKTTSRVSVNSQGVEANRLSVHHGVSFDGRYVAFSSEASNLVPDDTNGVSDIFVHDRETGKTTRVSISSRK